MCAAFPHTCRWCNGTSTLARFIAAAQMDRDVAVSFASEVRCAPRPCTRTHTRLHTRLHTHLQTRLHTFIHTFTHPDTDTHTHTHTR